jgi:hypothetical protein
MGSARLKFCSRMAHSVTASIQPWLSTEESPRAFQQISTPAIHHSSSVIRSSLASRRPIAN